MIEHLELRLERKWRYNGRLHQALKLWFYKGVMYIKYIYICIFIYFIFLLLFFIMPFPPNKTKRKSYTFSNAWNCCYLSKIVRNSQIFYCSMFAEFILSLNWNWSDLIRLCIQSANSAGDRKEGRIAHRPLMACTMIYHFIMFRLEFVLICWCCTYLTVHYKQKSLELVETWPVTLVSTQK